MKTPKKIKEHLEDIDLSHQKVLSALQGLYGDSHKTLDEVNSLKLELETIKTLLISILQYNSELSKFEKKLFIDNLKH